jgi:hypothetical protein
MAAAADFYSLAHRLGRFPGHRRLAHRVGERLQVVCLFLGRPSREPDHIPSPRRGQPVGVGGAQVVAVRLDVGR